MPFDVSNSLFWHPAMSVITSNPAAMPRNFAPEIRFNVIFVRFSINLFNNEHVSNFPDVFFINNVIVFPAGSRGGEKPESVFIIFS